MLAERKGRGQNELSQMMKGLCGWGHTCYNSSGSLNIGWRVFNCLSASVNLSCDVLDTVREV